MAHSYSTDSDERRYIPFFIAAAAIAATFLTSHLLPKIKLPWWASLPIDTMAFYGLFYWLFDRYLWKWSLVQRLRLTRIPDLSGIWVGRVRPIPADEASAALLKEVDITLSIHQTWTRLLVAGRTETSRSRSISGNFVVSDEPRLSYEYVNEPAASAVSTMHPHRGLAWLALGAAGTVLEGEYFSGRGRQTIGTIRVVRNPKVK